MTRRERAYEYYLNRGKLEKASASAAQIVFRGAATENAVVVRSDLNGYSKWVKDVEIASRVALLDEFFSHAIVQGHQSHGVYYRDEGDCVGDCVVTIFSPYFGDSVTYTDVLSFAKNVSGRTYGDAALSCKTIITSGEVTFYQKGPESLEGDWSAEGDPFITGARLEASVESSASVYCLEEDYDSNFAVAGTSQSAVSGQRYFWELARRNYQVQGLQATGGWKRLAVLTHFPAGRLQA
jgi:class 3 adenylate cyclase